MSYVALAFFSGLFGSLHCVAMCGPLVMALPLAKQSALLALLQRLLYQAGRILVYMLMGLLLGWIGSRFSILGLQQGVSIVTGALLVGLALFHFSTKKNSSLSKWQLKLISPLSVWMGKVLIKPYGGFFAGMLNGLIPCGMVYLALAGAVNTGSIMSGAYYMLYFGLGTTPLMLTASVAGVYLRKKVRVNFSSLLPYLTLCMGLWLVLRGAQLGIPYLSPATEIINGVICK
jgi:uncharacterized protein